MTGDSESLVPLFVSNSQMESLYRTTELTTVVNTYSDCQEDLRGKYIWKNSV